MPDHLPECLVPDFDKGLWICICNQLRACEERVRGEEQQRIEAALKSVGQHDAAWELAIRDKALREAREVVAGFLDTDTETGDRRCSDPECDLCIVAPLIYAALEDLILSVSRL